MFSFLCIEFLMRKRHWFLYPRFSLITMFPSNEILLSMFCIFIRPLRFLFNSFFFRNIFFFTSTFSFSIRDRHIIRFLAYSEDSLFVLCFFFLKEVLSF